ncbi:Enoyl-CoA delta isomerase 3 [Rhynchospora pubera]|uniref:Delta(3)-Delta(2)-enoyl-CoA isomerase n=1 Tax=Rhynchospora pubera TaxID=906938 RepID=A0AAV8DHK2_9POAL|nr:Enoyl-CoA delta isomerase 3 [Rhynchospora pubera]KAJ4820698.1 Enoyl-CoA delta isomerase 3 [Rhynchospora pubera]
MCTLEKRGNIYLLTLTGSGEHRFNPSLLSSLRAALSSLLCSSHAPNSALITCAEGKFFSNGFDQSWVRSAPPSQHRIISDLLRGLISDYLSLPMPTVCAVTGHAAAAGCALVLAHDYVVMREDRGFFYMSELDVGLKFVKYFEVFFNEKIPDNQTRRDVLLRSARVTAREAMARGIVDRAAQGIEGTIEEALRLAEEVAATVSDGSKLAEKRKLMFSETWRHVSAAGGSKL